MLLFCRTTRTSELCYRLFPPSNLSLAALCLKGVLYALLENNRLNAFLGLYLRNGVLANGDDEPELKVRPETLFFRQTGTTPPPSRVMVT